MCILVKYLEDCEMKYKEGKKWKDLKIIPAPVGKVNTEQ